MSESKTGGAFSAAFTYTDAVLDDFEAMYAHKKSMSPAMRVVLALLGAAGAVFFGLQLYREGMKLIYVGYLLISSVLLVLAFSGLRKRPDDSVQKYRRAYLGKKAEFIVDGEGVQLHLEGQKGFARSKFKEIYGLFDTDRCLYFAIKGRAYYIVPRDSVEGDVGELMKHMEKKCGRKFLHYEVKPSADA